MGFLDLFRPKWKHSDPKVRVDKVKKLIYQEMLTEIHKTFYKDPPEAAVCFLTDQAILADIIKKDKNVGMCTSAVSFLTDQTILADIAKNYKDEFVRSAAVLNRNLTDQTLLTDIFKSDKFINVRWCAVIKLTDQALLAEIAKNDDDIKVRSAAARNPYFTDQKLLAEIAKNDKIADMRLAAVENLNLTDPEVLAMIAVEDKDLNVRKTATEKIADQTLKAKLTDALTTTSPADFCAVCGKNCTGLPIMKHKPTGTACCEDCGRKVGVGDFNRLASNASRCPTCKFLYLASLAQFSSCPRCGDALQ